MNSPVAMPTPDGFAPNASRFASLSASEERRAIAREDFAAEHLSPAARLIALPADASFRRYFRITGTGQPMLLMDAPPGPEDLPAYLRIGGYLRDHGFAAPDVIAADIDQGFALIEDFGDQTYTRLLAASADEQALYTLAIDVLAALHKAPMPDATSGITGYSQQKLLAEAALFPDWYWRHVTGVAPTAAQRDTFMAFMTGIMADTGERRECLVLRDYHVDNLMLRDDQPAGSVTSCGLLDFQDGLIGARAYDLMSLLEDARRDIAPELAQAMRKRYLTQCPVDHSEQFDADYRALAISRHTKVLGIFVRLNERDGKPKYLIHLPRIARLLAQHLAHPSLAELTAFLDHDCPGWRIPKAGA